MDIPALLNALIDKRDLTGAEMLALMRAIMRGEVPPAQLAGLLIALRSKGECVEEIVAAARVMRELSTKVPVRDAEGLVDTCGTGGDCTHSFNVSTASAIVAAAAGARVAKHGGRSVSSACGSADVLEALGVNLKLTPAQVAQCIEHLGVGFMFAPNHHSAMKHAAPVRKELGVRTLFNLLGPLTNPASAPNQIMGVYDPGLVSRLARALRELGSRHAMVVSGAEGLDEISIISTTHVAELKDGRISEYRIEPGQFGLAVHALEAIQARSVQDARQKLLGVLEAEPGAAADIVALNAGAAIYLAGIAGNLEEGVRLAVQAIDSGAAKTKLQQLIDFTHRLSI
ncbi:MAG: anthranilate phosphoribosyltransferase [Burkholderiales bacterium]